MFSRNKIYPILPILFLTFFIGILGYRLLGDYSWLDATYMTAITMSTVGYGEVNPSDDTLKVFTIILIILSTTVLLVIAYFFSQYLSSSINREGFYAKKTKKMIKRIKDHIIVIGYGRTGKEIVRTLRDYNKKVVVVDVEDAEHQNEKNIYFIKYRGDISDESILLDAGIERASCLITTIPNDAENLFLVISARNINKDIKIISRINNSNSRSKLLFAGADEGVMVNKISGRYIANMLLHPKLITFLEILLDNEKGKTLVNEISIGEIPHEKTIVDLDIRKKTGCSVIAYITSKENIVNPDGQTVLEPNSRIIVLGNTEQIDRVKKLFGDKKVI